MGFWKSLGKGLNKVKNIAAPVAGFALGGPVGAAIAGGLARGIGEGRPSLKNMAQGAISGAATGALGGGAGLVGGKGIGAFVNSAKDMGVRGLVGNVAKSAVGMGPGQAAAGGAAGSVASGGGSGFQKLGLGWGDVAQLGTAAMGAYGGYQAGKQQDAMAKRAMGMQDKALQFAEQDWQDRARFRKLGGDMMMDQMPEDVAGLYATSNPMARRYRGLA